MPQLLCPVYISSFIHNLHHSINCTFISPGSMSYGLEGGVWLVDIKLVWSW
jgi:hypothetical protein